MGMENIPPPVIIKKKFTGSNTIKVIADVLLFIVLLFLVLYLTQKSKTMVTIINYKQRQKEDGSTFYVLEVQGGIEMVMSQTTNQFYATSKKASITSTFDEITCQALIGTQMQGSIIKEECEPYEYTVKDTGEVIVLHHRFVYSAQEPGAKNTVKQQVSDSFAIDMESLSKNGKHIEFA